MQVRVPPTRMARWSVKPVNAGCWALEPLRVASTYDAQPNPVKTFTLAPLQAADGFGAEDPGGRGRRGGSGRRSE